MRTSPLGQNDPVASYSSSPIGSEVALKGVDDDVKFPGGLLPGTATSRVLRDPTASAFGGGSWCLVIFLSTSAHKTHHLLPSLLIAEISCAAGKGSSTTARIEGSSAGSTCVVVSEGLHLWEVVTLVRAITFARSGLYRSIAAYCWMVLPKVNVALVYSSSSTDTGTPCVMAPARANISMKAVITSQQSITHACGFALHFN